MSSTSTPPSTYVSTAYPSLSETSNSTKSYPVSPSSQLTFKSNASSYRRSSTTIIFESNQPLSRRLTPLFQKYRKDVIERFHLESDRLCTRLKKFAVLFSDVNFQQPDIKESEQLIVKWQSDEDAVACPHCTSPFSFFLRKHHCRLCGLVICVTCSSMFPVTSNASIRICKACASVLLLKYPPEPSSATLSNLYQEIENLRLDISTIFPKLKEIASKLIHTHPEAETPIQVRLRSLAINYKKELEAHFHKLESCCQTITRQPTSTASQKTLHSNIVRGVTEYLELYLPQLESVMLTPPRRAASAPLPSRAIMQHPYLDTLVEQYSQVEAFLKEAQSKRRLDQVKTLGVNLEELKMEIQRVQNDMQEGLRRLDS